MPQQIRVPMPDSPASAAAVDVVRRLRAAGHSAYLVGGCVRDLLSGLQAKDYDIATSAHPPEVQSLFPHVVAVGVAFGVVRVRHALQPHDTTYEIEVATFRADVSYSDGRRPDAVVFTDAREDVLRRDFTINGLLLDPLDVTEEGAHVVDWVGGIGDLNEELLRAIGQPEQRFAEDALRMLRAPRFAARFGLRVEAETAAAIRAAAPTLTRVSAERIAAEIMGMLTVPTAPSALHLLHDLGLAAVLWPDLTRLDPGLQTTQLAFHRLALDVAPHHDTGTFAATHDVPWSLALAVLLWPVRKTLAAQHLATLWKLSRQDAQGLSRTWKLAEALVDLPPPGPARTRLLREDEADAALRLLLAHQPLAPWQDLRAQRSRTRRQEWWPVPHVTGEALIILGYRPGPQFRLALQAAEDVQLTGGTPEAALSAALAVLARPIAS